MATGNSVHPTGYAPKWGAGWVPYGVLFTCTGGSVFSVTLQIGSQLRAHLVTNRDSFTVFPRAGNLQNLPLGTD